jgi:hypothetical protein
LSANLPTEALAKVGFTTSVRYSAKIQKHLCFVKNKKEDDYFFGNFF